MTLADKGKLLAWRNSPDVSRNMNSSHRITEEEHDRWFSNALTDPSRWSRIVCVRGEAVGFATIYGVDMNHRRATWGFYVGEKAWRGQGVGAMVKFRLIEHAFEAMGLHKLCCEILSFNKEGVEMHKRFGFREEGYFREHILKDGQFHDLHCLALLRPEWRAMRAQVASDLERVEKRLAGGSPAQAGPGA